MKKSRKKFFQKGLCGILCAAMLLSGLSIPELTAYAAEQLPDKSNVVETDIVETDGVEADVPEDVEDLLEGTSDETVVSEEEDVPETALGEEETEESTPGEKETEENTLGEEETEETTLGEEETEEPVLLEDPEESDIQPDGAAGENLLTNGSFESGSESPWTITKSEGAAASAAVTNANNNNHTSSAGGYSLHFWSNDIVGFTVEQKVQNLPAGTYKFGGFIIGEDKANGEKSQFVYVDVYDSNDTLKGTRKTATCSILDYNAGWQNPEIKGIEVAEGDYLIVGMTVETAEGGAWGDIDDFYLYEEGNEEPTVSLNFYYGALDANAAEELGFYKWGDGITGFGTNNTLLSWGGWEDKTKNPVYKMTPVSGQDGWFNIEYTVDESITETTSKSGFSIFSSKDKNTPIVNDCSGYPDTTDAKHYAVIYAGLVNGTITAIRINADGELVGHATIAEANKAIEEEAKEPEGPEEGKVWTYEELTALIQEADKCKQEDYTPASWKTFATALSEAKKITKKSSETAITAAYEKLGIAKNTLAQGTISIAKLELSDDFITGADVSSYYSLKQSGVVFKDEEGNELDDAGFFRYLKEGGTNWIRIRVWNDPFDSEKHGYGGGNNDIEAAKVLGKLATDAGMKVLIDFHYSDFWADPGKQKEPKAWTGYTVDQKVTAIETYTKESLQALKDAGVDVGMVQVGNETTNKICGVSLTDWANSSKIFNAGSKGVRAVYPDALVAIHFTNPERAGNYANFAKNLDSNNVDYDVFASSYYPFWHGTTENLTTQLADIAKTYNKKVMVAETSWATTLADQDGHANTVRKGANDGNKDYGYSVQGQADEMRAVIKAINDVNQEAPGKGIGVFYWEAAWMSKNYVYNANGSINKALLEENQSLWETYGSGWAASYAGEYDAEDAGRWYGGSAVDNQSWFDAFGNALPTAKTYKYIRTGETAAEMAITGIESPTVTVEADDQVTYPDEVLVSFNDASKVSYPVVWNAADQAKVDTSTVGEYTVRGTVTCTYQLNNGTSKTEKKTAVLTVKVIPQVGVNILPNSGFEDGVLTPWTVKLHEGAAGAAKADNASNSNRHSGKWSLHFYNTGIVGFTAQQEVRNLEAGAYTFGGYYVGDDKAGGEKEQTAFVEVYDSEGNLKGERKTQIFHFTGSSDTWENPEITGIELAEGDYLIIGVSIDTAAGGAWGDFDDFYLYGNYNIAVDESIDVTEASVSVSRSRSVAGKTIDITATARAGYTLETLTVSGNGIQAATGENVILQSALGTVTQESGKVTVTYPENTTGKQEASFIMPNGSVVVSVTYKENEGGTVDKSELQNLIESYSSLSEKDYTQESWQEYKEKLGAAKEVLEKEDATQREVNKATADLEAAYKALVKKTTPDGLWAEWTEDWEERFDTGTDSDFNIVYTIPYTGAAVKPTLNVYDGDTKLVLKKDYTISYGKNKALGKATVTVKGAGNYTGSVVKEFTIVPKNLADDDVTIPDLYALTPAKPKKNKAVSPVTLSPVVSIGKTKLKKNRDYTVAYASESETAGITPGEHEVIVTGIGNYTGEKRITITLADRDSEFLMSSVSISKIANQKYDGSPIEPEITVKNAKKKVIPADKYEVEYRNNTEIGTATVIVTGKDEYIGQKTATFKITGTSLKDKKITVTLEAAPAGGRIYSGDAFEPEVTVKHKISKTETKDLTEDVDYSVEYSNNTNAGTATVTVTGINAYTGVVKKTFKITAYDISKGDLFECNTDISVPYAKGGSKPGSEEIEASVGGTPLVQNKDYTLSYANNTKIADKAAKTKPPTIKIKGKGNYKGTKAVTFTITAKSLDPGEDERVTITAKDILQKNAVKKNGYKVVPVLVDVDGKTLKNKTDYMITGYYTADGKEIINDADYKKLTDESEKAAKFSNASLQAGDVITVKVKGKGKYDEQTETETTFRILADYHDVSAAKITVTPQTYTGEEVEPKNITVVITHKEKNGKKQVTVTDTLKEGEDYQIIGYSNNINKGKKAKLTIQGIGEYGGTKTQTFTINAKKMSWGEAVTAQAVERLKEVLQ